MFEQLVNILSIVFMIALGGFIIVFLGDLMLSAIGNNSRGLFFKHPIKIKKAEPQSNRPVMLAPGQELDITNKPSDNRIIDSFSSDHSSRLDELLGTNRASNKSKGIDEAAAERERLLIAKRGDINEFNVDEDDDDEFNFEDEDEDEDLNIKDQLLKHLKGDSANITDKKKPTNTKTLAELEAEAIAENKNRSKTAFVKLEEEAEDEDDEIDEDDDEVDFPDDEDFMKDFEFESESENDLKGTNITDKPRDLHTKIDPVVASVDANKLKKEKEEAERVKKELEEELETLRKQKEQLEKDKLDKAANEVKEAERLKRELQLQKESAESEKESLSEEVNRLRSEKLEIERIKKESEASVRKQNEELRKNLMKLEELKEQLEEEMAKANEERLKLEAERVSLEAEKVAIVSKKKKDDDDEALLKKMTPFGLAGLSDYEKRIEDVTEQLRLNEKELKRTKKEYIPLDKVRRTLENDKKKLRTKEAIVARKKVTLYGVNNYVDLDDERARELSKELDLLEGLRLSVQNCDEVLQKNKDRLPILESNYRLLTQRNIDLKNQLEEYKQGYEYLTKK